MGILIITGTEKIRKVLRMTWKEIPDDNIKLVLPPAPPTETGDLDTDLEAQRNHCRAVLAWYDNPPNPFSYPTPYSKEGGGD